MRAWEGYAKLFHCRVERRRLSDLYFAARLVHGPEDGSTRQPLVRHVKLDSGNYRVYGLTMTSDTVFPELSPLRTARQTPR